MKLVQMFGFPSTENFVFSLIRPDMLKGHYGVVLTISATITVLIDMVAGASGIPPNALIAFFAANAVEWCTGVLASLKEGHSFSSWKLGRAVLKTFVYVTMFAILNQFKKIEGQGESWFLLDWTYWTMLTWITLILVRSIIENLHRMGVREAEIIFGILNNKFTKPIAFLFEPPKKDSGRT